SRTVKSEGVRPRIGRRLPSSTVTSSVTRSTDDLKTGFWIGAASGGRPYGGTRTSWARTVTPTPAATHVAIKRFIKVVPGRLAGRCYQKVQRSKGPKIQGSKGPKVQGSKGPRVLKVLSPPARAHICSADQPNRTLRTFGPLDPWTLGPSRDSEGGASARGCRARTGGR